jgi:NADH dehydrogenase
MIFIAGASGFVGSHLLDFLNEKGMALRCLARAGKAREKLLRKGAEVVAGDITRPETLKGVLNSDDIVIHLAGIIEEKSGATFQAVHVEGTRSLIAEAQRAGIRHFFYQSALGADKNSWSGYLRTKAEAEEIVKQGGIPFTIFRPSLIIGPWDGFTRKLVDMIRLSPVIPIPGEGNALFQPLYIKDWLWCMEKVLESPGSFASTYELGGPEHLKYREIVRKLADALGTDKPLVTIPMGLMKLSVGLFSKFMLRLPVTADQLRLLQQDNICDIDSVSRHFGFTPVKLQDAYQEFISS